MGIYSGDADIFHGTQRAFDSIRLPTEDLNVPRHAGDEYGVGFYTAINADDPEKAQGYAADYTEGRGLVLQGRISAGQIALLNLDEPLGAEAAERLRAQLNDIATGNPELDRYYRDVASGITEDTNGKKLWSAISESGPYERWHTQQNSITLDVAETNTLLRADRRTLSAALETHGIELVDIDALTQAQVEVIQENLRGLNPENATMNRYYNEVAASIEIGMKGRTITERLSRAHEVQRSLDDTIPKIDRQVMADVLDRHATTMLNNAGMDGVIIPHQDTAVFKGRPAIDRLPDLRVVAIVGSGPSQDRVHTDRPIAVGEVLIPALDRRAAGSPMRGEPAAALRSGAGIDTSDEAYARATTPEARAAILEARIAANAGAAPSVSSGGEPDPLGRRATLGQNDATYTPSSTRENPTPLDTYGLQRALSEEGLAGLDARPDPRTFGQRNAPFDAEQASRAMGSADSNAPVDGLITQFQLAPSPLGIPPVSDRAGPATLRGVPEVAFQGSSAEPISRQQLQEIMRQAIAVQQADARYLSPEPGVDAQTELSGFKRDFDTVQADILDKLGLQSDFDSVPRGKVAELLLGMADRIPDGRSARTHMFETLHEILPLVDPDYASRHGGDRAVAERLEARRDQLRTNAGFERSGAVSAPRVNQAELREMLPAIEKRAKSEEAIAEARKVANDAFRLAPVEGYANVMALDGGKSDRQFFAQIVDADTTPNPAFGAEAGVEMRHLDPMVQMQLQGKLQPGQRVIVTEMAQGDAANALAKPVVGPAGERNAVNPIAGARVTASPPLFVVPSTANDGPSASLAMANANDTPTPGMGAGEAIVEARTTAQAHPATAEAAEFSETAKLAANTNEVGANGRTAVADAEGKNSAAKFMRNTAAVPVAANDAAAAAPVEVAAAPEPAPAPVEATAPAPVEVAPAPANHGAAVHPVPVVAAAVAGATTAETVRAGGHVRTVHRTTTGAGAALGIYGLSQKGGKNGTLQQDWAAGGAQATLAVASTAGDGLAIAADTAGAFRGSGALGAVARRAALPVAVVAGALETGTAIAAHDGHRAATAAGATTGGLLGGVLAGAAAGFAVGTVVPGAGNVVGAVVGGVAGLVGGLVGAHYGGKAGNALAGDALERRLNADIDTPLNAMAGQLQRAGYTKMLDKDRDGKIEAHEVRAFVGADGVRDLRAAAKNGLTAREVTDEIKQQLTENYGKQMNALIVEARQKGWGAKLDSNHDGKYDMVDVRANLAKSGVKLDANLDGNITGGEFIRAQQGQAAKPTGRGH